MKDRVVRLLSVIAVVVASALVGGASLRGF
jgi:hypothetical protein